MPVTSSHVGPCTIEKTVAKSSGSGQAAVTRISVAIQCNIDDDWLYDDSFITCLVEENELMLYELSNASQQARQLAKAQQAAHEVSKSAVPSVSAYQRVRFF